jgi:valyl-tRNA synthetase
LQSLARLDAPGDGFAPTATVEVVLSGGPVHVELDTSGAIDVAAERARLGRDLAAAQKELATAEKKLGNPKFVEKAPAAVVDGIRTRRGAAVAEIDRVTARLAALPS